jgi:hypothetical protein
LLRAEHLGQRDLALERRQGSVGGACVGEVVGANPDGDLSPVVVRLVVLVRDVLRPPARALAAAARLLRSAVAAALVPVGRLLRALGRLVRASLRIARVALRPVVYDAARRVQRLSAAASAAIRAIGRRVAKTALRPARRLGARAAAARTRTAVLTRALRSLLTRSANQARSVARAAPLVLARGAGRT